MHKAQTVLGGPSTLSFDVGCEQFVFGDIYTGGGIKIGQYLFWGGNRISFFMYSYVEHLLVHLVVGSLGGPSTLSLLVDEGQDCSSETNSIVLNDNLAKSTPVGVI